MNGLYTPEGMVDKNALWKKYAYLVRHEALRLQVRLPGSVELDDLVQAGAIALLNAIDHYDPKKGIVFSTYITQRIRWALIDELRERDWVPRRIRSNAREIAAVIRRIEQRTGQPAKEADVAAEMNITLEEYQQMLTDTNVSQICSLDELMEEMADRFEQPDAQHEKLANEKGFIDAIIKKANNMPFIDVQLGKVNHNSNVIGTPDLRGFNVEFLADEFTTFNLLLNH